MKNLDIKESLLKESEEHGYEEYTKNVEKPKILMSFKGSCGCASGGGCKCGGKSNTK